MRFTREDFGRDAATLINMIRLDDDFAGANRDTVATPFASLGVDDYDQYLILFDSIFTFVWR